MNVTAFDIASRFIGVRELDGAVDNPFIMSMLRLDTSWPSHDEVPWCSAFINYVAWLLRLPRSKNLRARSWLNVGRVTHRDDARVGFDVVILKRGEGEQPGPEVTNAPGHVGFFAGYQMERVFVLGGNQDNSVCVAPFNRGDIIGVRRLA